MRRNELIKRLRQTAKIKGLGLEEVRDTGPHTIFRLGSYTFPVPRHREINEHTAQAIIRRAEQEKG
ncbi:MAG: type II toxin-antitoxin system HicA family toxin [Haloechinothrix sp.]